MPDHAELPQSARNLRDGAVVLPAPAELQPPSNTEAQAACELQRETDLLGRFDRDVERAGLVGEKLNAEIILLAAVSARLQKPVNVSVHGSSSAGKNHLTGAVARFIPDEMKKVLSGMSPKNLMHSEENEFQHKVVFVTEYAGVAGADFAIRIMQSEQVIEWEFVAQEKERGFVKKRNRVKGPAAFIQATTRSVLHPENETRLIFAQMDETEEQTRAINAWQAREAAGEIPPPEPKMFGEWHQLIRSLKTAPIVIPFAPQLAKHFPADQIRSRRDFPKLLGLAEASAFLHQYHRKRDSLSRILATEADYRIVRELFRHACSAGPDRAVAQLVGAAHFLGGTGDFTVGHLMDRLGWGKSKTYEILSRALDVGCVTETENRGQYRFLRLSPATAVKLPETISDE